MVADAVNAAVQVGNMQPTVADGVSMKEINVVQISLVSQSSESTQDAKRFLTYSRRASNVVVAYDVQMRKRVVLKTVAKTEESLPRLRKLLATMRTLSGCAHTLQLYDVVDQGSQVTFVYEFLPHGDLVDVIPADEGLKEEAAAGWVRQIAKALCELHASGYAHRDLKPDNIGLVRRPGQPIGVKLIDLDQAQHVSECNQSKAIGTLAYMAPELLDDSPVDSLNLLAADMWAFGIIIFALLTGRFPWGEASNTNKEYLRNVNSSKCMSPREAARGSRRPIGPKMEILLRGICAVDPRERWTAQKVMEYVDENWPESN